MILLMGILFIFGTIFIYLLSKKIYIWLYTPFTIPIVTSTVILVILLSTFHIEYETYMIGAKWIDALLGPAVVALAYPLYRQRDLLRRYLVPVGIGVSVGVVSGIGSSLLLTTLFRLQGKMAISLIPKSVTTPVAMEVSRVLGGQPELTAVYVMIAGIGGSVAGPWLLRLIRVNHPVARGVGLGTASHGIGTSRALEFGEKEAAISSIAMSLSAIITSVVAPMMTMI